MVVGATLHNYIPWLNIAHCCLMHGMHELLADLSHQVNLDIHT